MIENRPLTVFICRAVLILGVLFVTFPLYIALVTATLTAQQAVQVPLPLMPGPHLWSNIVDVWLHGTGNAAYSFSRMIENVLVAHAFGVVESDDPLEADNARNGRSRDPEPYDAHNTSSRSEHHPGGRLSRRSAHGETWALENGSDVRTVANLLGHLAPSTTLNVHGHVVAGLQTRAVEGIGDALALARARRAVGERRPS